MIQTIIKVKQKQGLATETVRGDMKTNYKKKIFVVTKKTH